MTSDNVLIPVDFEDLDDWLKSVGSDFSAAELHGALVGGLAGAMRLSTQEWSAFAFAVMGADEQLLLDTNSRKMLGALTQEQLDLLAGEDLSFVPFLPLDEVDIAERVKALSHWCKGFLGGFAEAQVHQGRIEDDSQQSAPSELPPNVAEALQDLTAIAHAAVDTDDFDALEIDDDDDYEEGGEPSDGEYNERDYCELVEYLRLAALTVFTEYGWVETRDNQQAGKVKDALKSAISLENSTTRTLH